MRRSLAVCLACSLAIPPGTAAAPQTPPPASRQPPSVEALGVSFSRIKRELGDKPPSRQVGPLKLDYYVEVVAMAPQIQLFTPEELVAGPVPGGAPTHWEMVRDLWTRQEFKSPRVPIGSIALMGFAKLIQWEAQKEKRRKDAEERRKRDEELRLKYPDLVVK